MQQTTPKGREGHLVGTVHLEKLQTFRDYRQKAGLLPEPPGEVMTNDEIPMTKE
jgi:hypothetical protein